MVAPNPRAVWWWVDRWRKSTAYSDMTLEEQGAYRNLLDEVWLRVDGVIPEDSLARISGDPMRWKKIGPKVLRWMQRVQGGWTHDTAREVMAKSKELRLARRMAGIKGYAAVERGEDGQFTGKQTGKGTGKPSGNETGKTTGNTDGQTTASPSPSPVGREEGSDPERGRSALEGAAPAPEGKNGRDPWESNTFYVPVNEDEATRYAAWKARTA